MIIQFLLSFYLPLRLKDSTKAEAMEEAESIINNQ